MDLSRNSQLPVTKYATALFLLQPRLTVLGHDETGWDSYMGECLGVFEMGALVSRAEGLRNRGWSTGSRQRGGRDRTGAQVLSATSISHMCQALTLSWPVESLGSQLGNGKL